MRRSILGCLAILMVAMIPGPARATVTVLAADGQYFYDENPLDTICEGTTDDYLLGVATRHWHVGIPFAPAAAEVAGGMGCLGGPAEYPVTIPTGKVGHVEGTIKYTWDQDVPGGGFNDVHLMVLDGLGVMVDHTVQHSGPSPIVPTVDAFRVNEVDLTLGPGTYTLVEDIFSGEHTAWLTNITLTVTDAPGGGGGY